MAQDIIGKVATQPELKSTSKGEVLAFRLVYSTGPKEARIDHWYDVSVWDDVLKASAQKTVLIGSNVIITGNPSTREVNGKTYTSVNAYRIGVVEWLERAPFQGGTQAAAPAPKPQAELPF